MTVVVAQKQLLEKQKKVGSHVLLGKHTKKFMSNINLPTSAMGATKHIITILHNRKLFRKIHAEHLLNFTQPNYSYEKALARMERKLEDLETIENRTNEEEEEMKRLKYAIEVLKAEYRAFKSKYSKFAKRDWKFCLSGDEYIEFRIKDGCTSFSKIFMAIANEKGLYQDMRLVVSACYDDLEENRHLLGTDGSELNQIIDGHQMVLAKWNDKWRLINVTHYRRNQGETDNGKYEIIDQINSEPISPEELLYQNVRLPGLANSPTHNNLVIVAIGKNRHDYLKVRNHDELMRLSLSIPEGKFDALN